MEEQDKKSYNQILKSTGIIGGSQVVNILIGIVRTKIVAVLLGPLGYGVFSSLQATVDLVRQATGFGINFSSVREISQVDPADKDNVSRIIIILKRWALYTGLLGTLVTILLCYPLSFYAFDNSDYTLSIGLVSVVLLITSLSAAQTAMLQGLRQLRNMAMVTILGSVAATVTVIPLYYYFGIKGIVPAMIISALSMLGISWWYARKINTKRISLTFRQTIKGGVSMAKLGLYLVLTSFIVTLIMYTVRAFIVREMNMDAVGWFQSSWSVANIYIGVVLSAMGADFFPRLSAIHHDNVEANKLINQQLEMVLLIIAPLLVGLIGGAELVINMLYSLEFAPAIPLLQWQLAGSLLTVISWCLGVMFLAKNKGNFALLVETIWGLTYLGIVVLTWNRFGFLALGIGYVVSSVAKTLLVVFAVKRLGDFSFSKQSLKDLVVLVLAVGLMLANVTLVDGMVQYWFSFVIFALVVVYCYRRISRIINLKTIFGKLSARK